LFARYVLVALSVLGVAVPARAELVYFATGRTFNVKDHRRDGDSLVLTLRGGGEVICDAALVRGIGPDEAPYPEPELVGDQIAATAVRSGPVARQLRPELEALIDRVAAREGVNARLVRAVIEVESGYRPDARSAKGAMGLMQLMPETARQYALSNPYDPAANIEAGIKHLRSLLERFPQALALAAYNAGAAAVERFGRIPPYAETRNYVSRILQIVGPS
jgi:hypothetical protein